MKKTVFTCILMMQLLLSNVSFGQLPTTLSSKAMLPGTSRYLEFLPPGYNDPGNATKKYPVIIYLHGCGEIAYNSGGCPSATPHDYTSTADKELEKLLPVGPNHEIANGSTMTFMANGVKQSFIVISPQLNNGNVLYAWNNTFIESVIKYALNNYRVNRKMVYLTGYSLGGNATYGYSMSTRFFADSLAAIAPVSAKSATTNACLLSTRDTPVWALHGATDTDNGNSYSSDRNFINALLACTPAPDPAPRFTVFPKLGHVKPVWLKSYSSTVGPDTTDLASDTLTMYKWFLRNPKGIVANQLPVANAGTDKVVTLSPSLVVTFTGTGSDPDGNIATYAWTKLAGPSVTMTNSNQATVSLTDLVAGVYTFRLTVTDNAGGTAFDDVILTCNQAPVVNAGTDAIITLPTNATTLTGSATDPDGTISTKVWTQQSGPSTASLSDPNQLSLSVTNLVEGTYIFRFTATDNNGGTAFDEVTVTVNPALSTGGWIQITSKGVSGKAVLLYYNAQKSNASQQPVRTGGNDTLQFYVKKISGTSTFSNLKVEVIMAYQSKFVYIGTYASNITTAWTKVSIPLVDFGHDAAKLAAGNVSAVDFKTISGFGTGVFGVDEIRFTGGTSPFTWYGNAYETSATPACVTQDTTAIFISNRLTSEGAQITSGNPGGRSAANISVMSEGKTTPSLEDGDVISIYNLQGQLLRKTVYCNDTSSSKITQYIDQPGVFIFKIRKSSGKIETLKISWRE